MVQYSHARQTDRQTDRQLHIGGYHGTDNDNAARIAESGFDPQNGKAFFAPLDNLSSAQQHGRRRAEALGHGTYTVVQGLFPGRELTFGLGGDQIEIPPEEVHRIGVVALLQFDLNGNRIPPPEDPAVKSAKRLLE